jgi:c-di-GMP-binding flagellar brake protein YcgR
MNPGQATLNNRRRHSRTTVIPAYTEIQVRPAGAPRLTLRGHVHDISAGGVRFELDNPLPNGFPVEIRIALPAGADFQGRRRVRASGKVLRVCNPGEPGSSLMAMVFDAELGG